MVRAEHLFAFAISPDDVKTDSWPEEDRLLMALSVIMNMEWLGEKCAAIWSSQKATH